MPYFQMISNNSDGKFKHWAASFKNTLSKTLHNCQIYEECQYQSGRDLTLSHKGAYQDDSNGNPKNLSSEFQVASFQKKWA